MDCLLKFYHVRASFTGSTVVLMMDGKRVYASRNHLVESCLLAPQIKFSWLLIPTIMFFCNTYTGQKSCTKMI